MFRLDGKTALVTGSAQNLGKEMVDDFATQGANVVVHNKSNDSKLNDTLEELRVKHDSKVIGTQFDVSDKAEVDESIEEIREQVDSIDILVNNAAIRPHEPIEEISVSDWEAVLDVNLTGAFNCTKAILPDMKENNWGRVINISGIDAYTGNANRIHTVTSKAGIIGFTRALTNEVAEYGITSNCVVPGSFDTTRDLENYPELDYRHQSRQIQTPLARIGQSDELSPVVLFLSSEEASFVTGQVIHVNGGRFPTHRSHDKVSDEEIETLAKYKLE